MRTATKIWLVVGVSLILLGAIIFATVMAILKWDFMKFGTEKIQTSSHEIAEDFNNISIHAKEADIAFLISEDESCKVVCYEKENAKHTVSVTDGTLNVHMADTRKWYNYIGVFSLGNPMITVYLPRAEYETLEIIGSTGDVGIPKEFAFESADISVSTGNISCHASASGDIKIKTSTGNICIESISAGSLDLSVSTGKVTLSNARCEGDVKISVSTGKANLSDVACQSLTSNGNTGDISLNNVIAAQKLSIERSTGDVFLESCDAAEIFIETDTGDVDGSLLSDKVFITETDTGRVDVPDSITGGSCRITTDTGNISMNIRP